MDMNNKTSEKEGIDIEENPSYDENEGNKSNSNRNNKNYVPRDDMISGNCSNSNEVVGIDDHYEDNSIISDDSDNKNKQMYPSDCYSFLSLYGPIKNPVYFFFGLVICLFQLAFLSLFVLSVLHKNLSSNGEVDNPDDGLLAQFVHSDADPLVRATQILAIISYSLFAESSLQDVVTGTFILWCCFLSRLFCVIYFINSFISYFLNIYMYVQLWKRFLASILPPMTTKHDG